MDQPFVRWSAMVNKVQEPFQSIVQLNVKTLESFNYLKLDDLTQFKNPEDFLEKQISMAVANGHLALDYMQKSFQIMEKAMLSLGQEVKYTTEGKK
jgi:hypothetical protein